MGCVCCVRYLLCRLIANPPPPYTNRRLTMAQVTGRNGYIYPATLISGNLYIVGKYIVTVVDGRCDETIARATKANVARYR